jgi:hypothetical protein
VTRLGEAHEVEPGERPFRPTAVTVIIVELAVLAALLAFQLRFGL